MSHSQAAAVRWDAIVIGTGLGGAYAGARLAAAGMKVLFIEHALPGATDHDTPTTPVMANVTIDGGATRYEPTSASAVGGTSIIYAGSLEMPARHDLDDSADVTHPTGGWPVDYDSFAPYFDEVSREMHICGTPDPLNPDDIHALAAPPPLCEGDADLERYLAERGYHTYRTHLGISFGANGKDSVGRDSHQGSKVDARQPLKRAMQHGAGLLAGWTVQRIETQAGAATGVVVSRKGEPTTTLTGDRIILAAGSICSAQLLLGSVSEEWPRGIGNGSDLVGRNLMFHLSERLAIFPAHRAKLDFPAKALATRDLYYLDGQRLGVVQSMGLQADYGNVLMYLRRRFDAGSFRKMKPLRPFLRLPAVAAGVALGNARVFVGILEDLPYHANRILPGSVPMEPTSIQYSIAPELHARRAVFRRAIREMFSGRRMYFLNEDVELNLGHACGTARFGRDPQKSVLDPDCRVHGLSNLYLTDASFMPTSTGVNPGMIIAANSLRVADRVIATARG